MSLFTLSEAAAITGGRLVNADPESIINNLSIDTRTLTPGALYVPVRGEVFDGHRFIPQAMEKGAVCTLSETDTPYPSIRVENCVKAFQQLAARYRERFDIPVIGITGSAGKTTTKAMVRDVLAKAYRVHATAGNLNNQTGVPQVLFGLRPETECAVIEMGTNHFGEIDALSAMVQPTICLFTNIGEAHMEFFGSREGIFRGKTEMLRHMRPGGTILANGDDDYLRTLSGALFFGTGENCTIRASHIRPQGLFGTAFTLHLSKDAYEAYIPMAGIHAVYNALAAAAAGYVLQVPPEDILSALAAFVPAGNRQSLETLPKCTLINDVYNANPVSMAAALQVLAQADGRRVCILGDMRELGDASAESHRRIIALAETLGIESIAGVGPDMAAAAREAGKFAFNTQEALICALPKLVREGDTALVKASRGMHLEDTVAALRRWANDVRV